MGLLASLLINFAVPISSLVPVLYEIEHVKVCKCVRELAFKLVDQTELVVKVDISIVHDDECRVVELLTVSLFSCEEHPRHDLFDVSVLATILLL